MKILFFALLWSTTGAQIFPPGCFPDVAFVVQTSTAISTAQLNQTMDVVKSFAQQLHPHPPQTTTAFVHYSNFAHTGIWYNLNNNLTEIDTIHELDNFTKQAEQYRGITDLDLGLKVAKDLVFIAGQDRINAPNVLILFSDGLYEKSATCCDPPFTTANQLRAKVHNVYAVEIGGNVNRANLVQIVGNDSSRVFTVDHALNGIITRLTSDITPFCAELTTSTTPYPTTSTTTISSSTSSTTTATTDTVSYSISSSTTTTNPGSTSTVTGSTFTQPTVTTPACTCNCMDLMLVFDASQSITRDSFFKIKAFAVTLIQQMSISQSAVRVGYVFFSDDVYKSFSLYVFNDTITLAREIFSVPYIVGLTNTRSGLQAALQYIQQGKRSNAPTVLYYFSDGRHNVGGDPIPVADQLRNQYNTTLISVGIPGVNGNLTQPDIDELRALSGCTTACSQVHIASNVNQLPYMLGDVLNSTPCGCNVCV